MNHQIMMKFIVVSLLISVNHGEGNQNPNNKNESIGYLQLITLLSSENE